MTETGETSNQLRMAEKNYDPSCGNLGDRVTSDMICFKGNPGIDACQGDSGGPLMCKIDGYYLSMGIVSPSDIYSPEGLRAQSLSICELSEIMLERITPTVATQFQPPAAYVTTESENLPINV